MRIQYNIGDVFTIPLENTDKKGLGRILKLDKPLIFIELYKISSIDFEYSQDLIEHLEPILKIWSVDHGVKNSSWKIIGRSTVNGEVIMPIFYTKSTIPNRFLLHYGEDRMPVTEEEVIRLKAQPSGIFGEEAVVIKYSYDLKKCNLI